jgi:hypothetical protein
MAQSYQIFTAAGNASSYALPDIQAQGYMNLSDLKVYLNGSLSTSGYTIVTSPSLALNFSVIPANGTIIKVQRETNSNASGRAVDFDNGSVLTAEDLDKSALQNLYIAQETKEGIGDSIQKGFDGQWDAEGLRIKNVADPVLDSDAVTKQYVDGIELYGQGIAVPQSWSFVGNGSASLFALSPEANAVEANLFIVEVGGVIQRPGDAYTIPTPGQLQLASAPANGVPITVRNFGASRSVANWDGNVTFTGEATFTNNVTMAGSLSVDTNVLKVDPTNNRVGINKTTPTEALDVTGTVKATAFSGPLTTTGTVGSGALTVVGDGSIGGAPGTALLNVDTASTTVTVNGNLNVVGTFTGGSAGHRVNVRRTNALNSTASITDLVFNSASINDGSAYNTSTGVWTAPTGGYYFVCVDVSFAPNGTGTNLIRLTDGAATTTFKDYTIGANLGVISISVILYCNAGDTLKVRYFGVPATPSSLNNNFSCHLIGTT